MQTITITYLLLALLISIGASWFLYFYKSKDKRKVDVLLFGLRAVSVFLILLLLINPTIERHTVENEKPVLSVLVDNSLSIAYFKQEKSVSSLVDQLKTNTSLNDRFDINYYSFGTDFKIADTTSFKEPQTNIYNAINSVEELNKKTIAPIVLISDGNQTTGSAYQYIKTNKNIFPIVIGDTLTQNDLRISQLNVNKYSYLKNKFPIEARVLYEGNTPITAQFRLKRQGKTIYKQRLSFSKNKNVQTITTNITSTKEGTQYYSASIDQLKNEKNVENNSKTFSIEVINEQTKILVLTSVVHPDLGAFKKSVETNKQRSVVVEDIKNFKAQIHDFQLIVFVQPNEHFNAVFEKVNKEKKNYLVITGAQTNWSFLNEVQPNYSKNTIQQTEDYGAIFNNGFLTYGQKDIGFNEFPALKDVYGKITMKSKYNALLYQNISGIETQTPLFATFENGAQKSAVLLGEGFWKWRASSFINTGSFQDFDTFISNAVQYLASKKKRERLDLKYEKIFPANTPISITAFYVDKNYQFDTRAQIALIVTNLDTKISQNVPFSLQNNSFEAVLEELPAGNYSFVVKVDKQNISKSGRFKITSYQIEEQFTQANIGDLSALVEKTKGNIYLNTNQNKLFNDLLNDKRYFTTQKTVIKNEELIEWQLLLFIAIGLFTLEWFIRKYYGKI